LANDILQKISRRPLRIVN